MISPPFRLRRILLVLFPIAFCLLGIAVYAVVRRDSPVLITLWGDPEGGVGSTWQVLNPFRDRALERQTDRFLKLLVSKKYKDAFALPFAIENSSYSEREAEHPLTRYVLSSINGQNESRIITYATYRLINGKVQPDEHIKFICRHVGGSWYIESISIVY